MDSQADSPQVFQSRRRWADQATLVAVAVLSAAFTPWWLAHMLPGYFRLGGMGLPPECLPAMRAFMLLFLLSPAGCALIFVWMAYTTSDVVTVAADGVTRSNWLHRWHLAWDDVAELHMSARLGPRYMLSDGGAVRITIEPLWFFDQSEALIGSVEEHIEPAWQRWRAGLGGEGRTWGQRKLAWSDAVLVLLVALAWGVSWASAALSAKVSGQPFDAAEVRRMTTQWLWASPLILLIPAAVIGLGGRQRLRLTRDTLTEIKGRCERTLPLGAITRIELGARTTDHGPRERVSLWLGAERIVIDGSLADYPLLLRYVAEAAPGAVLECQQRATPRADWSTWLHRMFGERARGAVVDPAAAKAHQKVVSTGALWFLSGILVAAISLMVCMGFLVRRHAAREFESHGSRLTATVQSIDRRDDETCVMYVYQRDGRRRSGRLWLPPRTPVPLREGAALPIVSIASGEVPNAYVPGYEPVPAARPARDGWAGLAGLVLGVALCSVGVTMGNRAERAWRRRC